VETKEVYVLDTIGFVSHLLDALPQKPEEIIERAQADECELILPSISLGEAIYVFMKAREVKGRVVDESAIWEMLDRLERGAYIKVEDLDFKDWKRVVNLPYRDLHDRMIVAKALRLNATLITNDEEITESKIVPTTW